MADIDEMDELGKREVLMRLELDISRMSTQIDENKFKLFMMEKDKQRLTTSIKDADEEIKKKQAELKKHRDLWGM